MDSKIIIIIIITAILICLFTISACYIYVSRTFDMINDVLEMIIDRKEYIALSDSKDTRQSKLVHQARKVITIINSDINKFNQEKELVKGLIADVSHQLKTPLSNILMYTDLLEDNSLNQAERFEFIKRTKTQAIKMEWLMKSLVKASRLEIGALEFVAIAEYIRTTIAESVSAVYSQADARQIQIVVNEFKDIKLLHNRKWTSEAITNILENAIKYSPEKSQITITVIPMDIYTKIQIKDRGIGIDKKNYNNIFKRFYRAENVKTYDGSGIGLYLSQIIVSKQGGYINLKSEIGKGSTFSVFLQNCNN